MRIDIHNTRYIKLVNFELSKAIKKLVFNKDLIDKFGKNSRILVKKRFSNQIVSNQFKKVYKEFLK